VDHRLASGLLAGRPAGQHGHRLESSWELPPARVGRAHRSPTPTPDRVGVSS
jgi:hypothetical protein